MPAGFSNTIIDIMGRLVVQENGCCLWTGGKVGLGYGRVGYQGRLHLVHKLLYEHFVGPVPDGKVLDHFVCDNKSCGNFAHVRPVTPRENVLRGEKSIIVQNQSKRECKNGHPFGGDNLIFDSSGNRRCRTCMLASAAKKLARLNAERTHCPNGHAYEGENLLVGATGNRCCRICLDAKARDMRARMLAKAGRVDGFCKKGHEIAGDNLMLTNKGHRICLTCRREWKRMDAKRKREERNNGRPSDSPET